MMIAPRSALAAALLLCAGCSEKPAPPPPDKVPVTVATVEVKPVPIEIASIGHVEPFARVEVKTRVGGEVKKVAFAEGDDVRAGALLFRIDPGPYAAAVAQAEANLERDRARARNAKDVASRYSGLVGKEYVTQEQFGEAEANAAAAEQTVKADEAALADVRLQRGYCDILAPISGRTGSLLIHAGNVVKANDDRSLVAINQVEPILVAFAVPESELGRIKEARARGPLLVEVTTRDNRKEKVPGTLSFIDNQVDAATGTILLKATFPNRERKLWPGQFVDTAITLGIDARAVVVPSVALQTGQSGDYVFVIGDDLKAQSRKVKVARSHDDLTMIGEGLAGGERVVTDGQLRLAPGTAVEVREPGQGPARGAAAAPGAVSADGGRR